MEPSGIQSVTYGIDAGDRMTFVGATWAEFARANKAPELTTDRVVGQLIWDFFADLETIHLYEMLLEKTRTTGRTLTVPFRCDAPALRRSMELRISPVRSSIQFESRLIRSDPRAEMSILDAAAERTKALQKICCWCKRMAVGEKWMEVEDAIVRLGLFHRSPLPMLTHVVCQDCREIAIQRLT